MSESEQSEQTDDTDPSEEVPSQSNVTQLSDVVAQRTTLEQEPIDAGSANMGLILDIPVTVSMELGRARISIRELLSMNPGGVIELERLASEPMEILVNGTLVAHGEAVKVGDRYGVRLTNVVNAGDRLKQVNV